MFSFFFSKPFLHINNAIQRAQHWITLFALAFKPWEVHELEVAVLEMTDVLNEIVREKKDKFEQISETL